MSDSDGNLRALHINGMSCQQCLVEALVSMVAHRHWDAAKHVKSAIYALRESEFETIKELSKGGNDSDA